MTDVLHYLFTDSAEFRLARVYKSAGWFISEIWPLSVMKDSLFAVVSILSLRSSLSAMVLSSAVIFYTASSFDFLYSFCMHFVLHTVLFFNLVVVDCLICRYKKVVVAF